MALIFDNDNNSISNTNSSVITISGGLSVTSITVSGNMITVPNMSGTIALVSDVNAITLATSSQLTPLTTTAALTGQLVLSSSLNNYTLLTTTSALTGNLQTQITGVSQSLSAYTTLTATNALTGQLTTLAATRALSGKLTTLAATNALTGQLTTLAATRALSGQLALVTSLQTTAGNLYTLVATTSSGVTLTIVSDATGNALAQANAYTNSQLVAYTSLSLTNSLTGNLQSQINSKANTSDLSAYTLLTTTNALTSQLALVTSLQTTAGNLQNQITNNNNDVISNISNVSGSLTNRLNYLDSDVVRLTGDQDIYGFKSVYNNFVVHVEGDAAVDMLAENISSYSEISWSTTEEGPAFGIYVSTSTDEAPVWTDTASGKYISFWGYGLGKDLVTIDISGNMTVNGGGIAILSLAETSCGSALTVDADGRISNSGYTLSNFVQYYVLNSYTTKAEVASLTGSLQSQIDSVSGLSNEYTTLILTASLTGNLQNQISVLSNSLSGYTTYADVASISSSLTPIASTAQLTGSLQQQINSITASYATLVEVANVSAHLHAETHAISSYVVNLSASQVSYIPNITGYWYDSSVPSTVKTAIDNLSSKLYIADYSQKKLQSTGKFYGGEIAIVGSLSVNISAGTGVVIDQGTSDSSGLYPQYIVVHWNNISNVSLSSQIPNVSAYEIIYTLIDQNGSLIFQVIEPDPQDYRQYIYLGRIVMRSGSIVLTRPYYRVPQDLYAQIEDLAYALGGVNIYGNVYSASASSLGIVKSAGQSYRLATTEDASNPSVVNDPVLAPVSYIPTYLTAGSSGTLYATATTYINPNKYDNGSGILQDVSANAWTIQYIYFFPQSNNTYVWYGRKEYASIDTAIQGITRDQFTLPPYSRFDSTAPLRGALIVKQGATSLSDPDQALFINASKFGELGSGGGAGGGGSTQLTNFSDADFFIYDDGNNGHKLKYNLNALTDGGKEITIFAQNIPDGTNLSLTLPNISGTLALVSEIASVSAGLTPITTTAGLTANLQTQINNISAPSLSGYTLLTTTAALTGNLQSQITTSITGVQTQISNITGTPYVLDSRYYPAVSADARFVHLTGNENISGNKNFGGVVRVNNNLYSFQYVMGTGPDLSLIPVVGGQSVLTSWWGLQLVGNKQSAVEYSPANIGGAGHYTVIIPTSTSTVSAGLMQRAAASGVGANSDFIQWQDSSGNVLSRIRSNGYLNGEVDYTPDVSGNWRITPPTTQRQALDMLSNRNCITMLSLVDDFMWGSVPTTTIMGAPVAFILETGTGGTTTRSASEKDHPGINTLATGTSNNQVGRASLGLGNNSLSPSGADMVFEAIVRIPTLSTAAVEYSVVIGLVDNAALTSITQGIYFIYDRVNFGNSLVTNTANTALTQVITTSVVANTWYKLRFEAKYSLPTPTVYFYINDVLQSTHTTNLPRGLCGPRLQIRKVNTTGTSRTLDIDYFSFNMSVER